MPAHPVQLVDELLGVALVQACSSEAVVIALAAVLASSELAVAAVAAVAAAGTAAVSWSFSFVEKSSCGVAHPSRWRFAVEASREDFVFLEGSL